MKQLVRKTAFKKLFVLVAAFGVLSITSHAQQQTTICSGATLSNVNPAASSGVTYTWGEPATTGATAGATAQSVGQSAVNSTLINLTAVAVMVSYTVTCSNPAFNFTLSVTLNPTPTVAAALTTTDICSGGIFSFTASSATTNTTVSWSRAAVSGIAPDTRNGVGTSIVETLINNEGSQRTATYTINLSANGCTNVQPLSVNVNPLPVLNSTLTPADICSSSPFSYNPTSALIPPGSFAWLRSAVAGITDPATRGTDNPNESLTNNTSSSVTVQYVYTLTAASSGCTNSQTVSVQVNPVPLLTSATAYTICSGNSFTYTASSSLGGTTFNWSRGTVSNINPAGNSGIATPNVNEVLTNESGAAAIAVYVFSLSAGGCTTNDQNVSVTVNPLPELSSRITADNVCSGISFNYTPTALQSQVNFVWNRAVAFGITNPPSSGTGSIIEALVNSTNITVPVLYEYTLTNVTTSCINKQIVTVSVNPIPVINDQTITVCNNNGFIFIPTTTPIGITYKWINPPEIAPGGAITNTLSAQPNEQPVIREVVFHNGTGAAATVKYTVTPTLGGCTGQNFVLTVTVNAGTTPTIEFAPSLTLTPPPVCSSTPFAYTFDSPSPSPTFQWDRLVVSGIPNSTRVGVIGTSINETLINIANSQVRAPYYITVTSGGCSNGFIVNALVNPTPRLSSTVTPVPICSNTNFSYSPTSRVTTTSQFNWSRAAVPGISNSLGNGSGIINETLVNTTSAPVSVRYTFTLLTATTPSCTNSETVTLIVNPSPVLSSPATIQTVCSN